MRGTGHPPGGRTPQPGARHGPVHLGRRDLQLRVHRHPRPGGDPVMSLTLGTFSYLPDLTDEEIALQLRYAIGNGWAVSIESTGDPRPAGNLWEMWGLPMFG